MKFLRLLSAALIAAALLLPGQSKASQNSCVLATTGTVSGLTLVNAINSCFGAILTNSSGSSAPSSPVTYQLWADTSTSLLKQWDGATWIVLGKFSGSTWTPFSGGATTVAITSTGSANAYVLTYSPAPAALVTGQAYSFIANFMNTGAATLTVNGLGPFNITKNGNTPLVSGDINSGQVVRIVYDGTQAQMVSPTANSALSGGNLTAALNFKKGASVASASTADIWAPADGNLVHITGTTTINSFGTAPQAGAERILIFDGAVTLTNGTNLVLPGATNYTTTAGDVARITADTTAKMVAQIIKADGTPVVAGSVASLATLHQQAFTSSGTFTCPGGTTTSTLFKFTVTGGGGGAGNNSGTGPAVKIGGAGGGAGATAIYYASGLAPSCSVTVTIGAAGGTGASGSNSSIVVSAVTVTATGGAGAASGNNAGAGGTATNGTINLGGGSGAAGSTDGQGGGTAYPGVGGASFWGGGGKPGGFAATAYGAGGGGGATGGAGMAGVVLVEWVL